MTRPIRVTRWRPPDLQAEKDVTVILTPRQAQVLTGICLGRSYADIGRDLFLSENSIKTHVRRLFAVIHAKDRAHAAALAHQLTVAVDGTVKNWSSHDD